MTCSNPSTPRREAYAAQATENALRDEHLAHDLRLRRAASRAGVLFDRERWTWGLSPCARTPTRAEIRETFEYLERECRADLERNGKRHSVHSTGRLEVAVTLFEDGDDYVEYKVSEADSWSDD